VFYNIVLVHHTWVNIVHTLSALSLISTKSKGEWTIWFVQHNQGTQLSVEWYLVEEKPRFYFSSVGFPLDWWRNPDYNDLLHLTNTVYHTDVGCMLCLCPMGYITVKSIQLDILYHTTLTGCKIKMKVSIL
jgi:hypothetical protein